MKHPAIRNKGNHKFLWPVALLLVLLVWWGLTAGLNRLWTVEEGGIFSVWTADGPEEHGQNVRLAAVIGGLSTTMIVGVVSLLGLSSLTSGKGLHGTARFAGKKDLASIELFAETGISLGRFEGQKVVHGRVEPVWVVGDVRSGKTQGPALCTLLDTWDAGMVVIDPKGGELYSAAAGDLRSRGYRVIRICPTRRSAVSWNPHFEITPGDGEVAALKRQAKATYAASDSREFGGSGAHFRERAELMYMALSLHGLYGTGRRSCGGVLESLQLGAALAKKRSARIWLSEVASTRHDPNHVNEWKDEKGPTATHPVVRNALLGLAHATASEELSSIISTAQRGLSAWQEPLVVAATEKAQFSFVEMARRRAAGEKIAVFLTLDRADDLKWLSGYVRMFLTAFAEAFAPKSGHVDHARAGLQRMLLMVDEVARLGQSESLATMLSTVGGAGVAVVVACQGLEQLKQTWGGRQDPISSGCPVWLVTATEDLELLSALNKKLGPASIAKTSRTVSRSWRSGSTSVRNDEQRRELMTIDELRTLDGAMLLAPGIHPAILERRLAFEEPELASRLSLPVGKPEPLRDRFCAWRWAQPIHRGVYGEATRVG